VCGWQVKPCDPIVTHESHLSALRWWYTTIKRYINTRFTLTFFTIRNRTSNMTLTLTMRHVSSSTRITNYSVVAALISTDSQAYFVTTLFEVIKCDLLSRVLDYKGLLCIRRQPAAAKQVVVSKVSQTISSPTTQRVS